ncbi:MAG: DNA double-strand break repair Rad50 ATPase [Methanoregula sp. PtaU1.Bin051]|nr:MAG: DNA double-strand break repair Rad50 ATPase [Methanoregula sp. PtaU1.Bin051]
MIIDRLVLKNFKRFRNEEIRFKDGITGILGNNGTGKSSLVQAIFFALYGVQATGIAPDYIVSSFASPREKCEIRLDFRIGGDHYSVHRTFKKGKTVQHDASFYKDGKERANGVSAVEEEVRRTLGMGPVDFRNTIYAVQKDLLTLLENTPGKRKEWFLKALGIDYLNTESQRILKERADKKTADLQLMNGRLDALTGQLDPEELETLHKSVDAYRAAIREHSEKRDLLKKERSDLERQQKVLAEKKAAYAALLQKQDAVRQELSEDITLEQKLKTDLKLMADEEAEYHRIEKTATTYAEVRARLDDLQKQMAEHARLTRELGFVQREINDLAARIKKQESLIAGLDGDAAEMSRLVAGIRAGIGAGPEITDDRLEGAVSYRLAEVIKRAGTLTAQLERYKEEREKLSADRETIEKAGPEGVCPLCRQKLGAHFQSLDAEFSARLEDLAEKAVADLERQEQLGRERSRIESLRPALDSVRTIAGRLKMRGQYDTDLSDLRKAYGIKMQEQEEIGKKISDLAYDEAVYIAAEQEAATVQKVQARFTELGKKIGQAAGMKQQLADLASRITRRNGEITQLGQEIAKAAIDPQEITKVESAIAGNDAALRTEEILIANAQKDMAFAEEKIAGYKRTEEQIGDLKKQAGNLKEEIELVNKTRKIIAEFVNYIMQVVRSRLEGEVGRIIGEITGGRYEQVLLDKDFNLAIRDVDADYPVERFSGGEQDDIAVALRIALSRYLAELHNVQESTVLIFDEIFGSQDEERRNNLMTALRTQESRFPQILLITHIAEVQGEFAHTLLVEMGPDMASRVNEVE